MWFAATAGLVAGGLHALSGPDHLAAVAALAVERARGAALTGALWGAGHGLGVLMLALVVFLGRSALDLELLGAHAEGVVGLVLVATGLWTLLRARHHHDSDAHHSHAAAFGIGTLHGSAGGSHLLVGVATLALPASTTGFWLGGFLLGAIAAMTGAAGLAPLVRRRTPEAMWRRVRGLTGFLAIAVGVAWAASAWT